jgi:signal transduction histidine kinase
MESKHVERSIVAAFAAVVLSFVSATWFSERKGGDVERDALSIHGKAAPSIRRLGTARTELRRLQFLVHRGFEEGSDTSTVLGINAARELLDEELAAYETLPAYPGERAIWRRAKSGTTRLNGILAQIIAALGRPELASARELEIQLDVAADDLARLLSQDVDVNVATAATLAGDIETSRQRGLVLAAFLDGIGILLAIVAAMWSLRVARAHGRAVEACRVMAERRAEELDHFAGRMAHDVRNPLSALGISLSLADRHGGDDPRFRRAIERARDAERQVEATVEALLDFARSGARPDPAARTSVADAAERVASNMRVIAEHSGVDITVRSTSGAVVACAPGLIESVIGNLVSNALTYVEGRDKRLVSIEVADDGLSVNAKVSDTGPGLLAGTDPVAIFEPHVRGEQARGRGMGLGLATVKKVIGTHGGRVGVSSCPDGCVFWFSLPIASTAAPIRVDQREEIARSKEARGIANT